LNDTTLTAGELTAALADIELGAINSGDELQDYFENDLGLSLELTEEQYDTLATKINNFDFKKGNYEAFFNSLEGINEQAAMATALVNSLGDAVPKNLETTYTIIQQTIDLKNKGTLNSSWTK
jgi:hypothetical protein